MLPHAVLFDELESETGFLLRRVEVMGTDASNRCPKEMSL